MRQTMKTIAHRTAKPPMAPPDIAPTNTVCCSSSDVAVVLVAAGLLLVADAVLDEV